MIFGGGDYAGRPARLETKKGKSLGRLESPSYNMINPNPITNQIDPYRHPSPNSQVNLGLASQANSQLNNYSS